MGGSETAVGTLVAVAGAVTVAMGLGGAASGVGLAVAVRTGSFPLHASREKITKNETTARLNFSLGTLLPTRNLGARRGISLAAPKVGGFT